MANKYKIPDKEWSLNLWERIKAAIGNVKTLIGGLDDRVTALEEGGGGGGGGGQMNVIEAVSFNGANVPPDANKRVSMSESDPTVPSWAKQSSKPSYTASEVGALPANTTYVSGVKGNAESSYRQGNVNITPANIGALPDTTPIPSNTSDLTNDSGFLTAQTGVTGVKGIAESTYRSGNVVLNAGDVAALAKGNYGNISYIVRHLNNADISQADNGVNTGTSISGAMIGIDDDAGNSVLDLVGEVFKTGAVRYKFVLRNIGATPVSFGGYVDLNKDGTATLFFSHPAAIRQALDIIEATTTQAGLMSAADKTKLDGIAPGGDGVTGVKGDAESSYRQGNVNLTPANIGAAADSYAMQFRGWYPNGQSMFSLTPGYYQTNPNALPSETFPSGINTYGTLCVDSSDYKHITYISVLGDIMIWKSNGTGVWYIVQHEGIVPVSSGGTGVTQGTIDITDQCSWHGSFYSKNLIYNPYLKMVFGSFAVYGNVANQAYLVTLPSSVPIVSKTPCGIGTSNTNGVAIAVDFEGRNLKSSHSVNSSVSEPRYVIQAYVG